MRIVAPHLEPNVPVKLDKQSKAIPKKARRYNGKGSVRVHKKRTYPRVQSEISLSTISEEPQTDAPVHDMKFDFSIRCF